METLVSTETSSDPLETFLEDLGSLLWKNLKDGDYESAVREIKEEKHQEYLIDNSLDVVPIIIKLLQEDLEPEGERCVEDLLVHIASVANVREALLVFLEELEFHTSEIHFHIMLQPVQTLLLRQVSKNARPMTFSWAFDTLNSRIAAMKLPPSYNLEGKERKLLDAHPDIQAVTSALRWLANFYEVFHVKIVNEELIWTGKVVNSREYLSSVLLQLFHKPFTYLDVYCEKDEVEHSLYRTCRDLTTMIASLMCNVYKLFSNITWNSSKILATEIQNDEEQDTKERNRNEGLETKDEQEKKDEISQLSLATFLYCVLGQDMGVDYVPCVYAHQYVFLTCLPLISNLLQEKEHIPIHKGLILAKALLDKLPQKSLPSETHEAKAHSIFPRLLIGIMTFCDNRKLGSMALDVFQMHIRKFDSIGRRKLIQSLLLSVKHSGVLSLVIHELKENIACSLNKEMLDPNFSGKQLRNLVQLACSLPDAEKTDMLEWSDCIMAALNLLIFLFLRDHENKTGIKEVVPVLQQGYLSQLQKGLDLSKGHYELKLKDLTSLSRKTNRMDMNVCVGNTVLPNMAPDQEKTIVQTAICSLDMMQCVLARVTQAIENKI
ncbi:glomulin isoform X1 [Cherax quadricarinatus]|uniref:glomulin isoform X1 n=1 Tax=Cherax quadricarinatus TaxID=27406 RepID=UPI0023791CEE|nr:glomulin-like isoform X1 [Cherax quadricarinatus]XP_053631194.1 glomulin-like isoform X1 [Cherax quadricarinatus]